MFDYFGEENDNYEYQMVDYTPPTPSPVTPTNPDNTNGPYWGKDDGEGHTSWYDKDGNLDTSTETPSDYDDDPYQRRLDEHERTHY